MVIAGIKGKKEQIVTKELTAEVVGSGTLPVYATPAMAALMEQTAYESVEPYLKEGEGTVGSLLNISHLSPSVVGAKIICESELIQVEGKKLVFHVKASDEAGIIGEGEHVRFIISEEKFMEKAASKASC